MASLLHACFYGYAQNYASILATMQALHERVVAQECPNQLMLLEHAPVITITRQHMHRSIKTSQEAIHRSGIDICIADRGGDATFHGPGQLVGYPIFRVDSDHNGVVDISRFIRSL